MRTPQRHMKKTGWICFVLLVLITGCYSESKVTQEQLQPVQKVQSTESNESKVEIVIDGGTFVPSVKNRVFVDWYEGLTVREALLNTGSIKMNEDEAGVASVVDVALDSKTSWSVQLNDKEITTRESFDSIITLQDRITVYAKKLDVGTSGVTEPSVTLTIDGGNDLNEITNAYLIPWQEAGTLAAVFADFEQIQLSEDRKRIVKIGEHELDEKHVVTIKVNEKKINSNNIINTPVKANDHIMLEIKQ